MLNFKFYLLFLLFIICFNYVFSNFIETDDYEQENFEVDGMMEEELMNYAESVVPNDVKPSNLQPINENTSNFISNVMDIDNFYKVSNDLPNTVPQKDMQLANVDEHSNENYYLDNNNAYKMDMWKYKNESVMNGGNLFGDVSGYDDYEGFSSYNNDFKILTPDCKVNDMYDDDLRAGLGKPNKYNRMTN